MLSALINHQLLPILIAYVSSTHHPFFHLPLPLTLIGVLTLIAYKSPTHHPFFHLPLPLTLIGVLTLIAYKSPTHHPFVHPSFPLSLIRVAEWTYRLEPMLRAQEASPEFDIHTYSDLVLSEMDGNSPSVTNPL